MRCLGLFFNVAIDLHGNMWTQHQGKGKDRRRQFLGGVWEIWSYVYGTITTATLRTPRRIPLMVPSKASKVSSGLNQLDMDYIHPRVDLGWKASREQGLRWGQLGLEPRYGITGTQFWASPWAKVSYRGHILKCMKDNSSFFKHPGSEDKDSRVRGESFSAVCGSMGGIPAEESPNGLITLCEKVAKDCVIAAHMRMYEDSTNGCNCRYYDGQAFIQFRTPEGLERCINGLKIDKERGQRTRKIDMVRTAHEFNLDFEGSGLDECVIGHLLPRVSTSADRSIMHSPEGDWDLAEPEWEINKAEGSGYWIGIGAARSKERTEILQRTRDQRSKSLKPKRAPQGSGSGSQRQARSRNPAPKRGAEEAWGRQGYGDSPPKAVLVRSSDSNAMDTGDVKEEGRRSP